MAPKYKRIGKGTVYAQDAVSTMRGLKDASVQLVLTSPPYDNLRDYKGYDFDFKAIAKEIYRVCSGTLVWIVSDAKINGSETGSSFRQALYFMKLGFRLNDTMIWNKGSFSAVGALKSQYAPVFEYMFVFTKPGFVFNPIKDRRNKCAGRTTSGSIRQKDGRMREFSKTVVVSEFGQRFNVWDIPPKMSRGDTTHPAPFPINLARDHILSWSNPGHTVLDPMCGSGTTLLAAEMTGRPWIGGDTSLDYAKESYRRVKSWIERSN